MLLPRTAVDRGNREPFLLNPIKKERKSTKINTKKSLQQTKIQKKQRPNEKNCLPSANFGFGGILAVIVAVFYVIFTPKFWVCFALNLCRSFWFTPPWPKINYELWKLKTNQFSYSMYINVLILFAGYWSKILCDKMEKMSSDIQKMQHANRRAQKIVVFRWWTVKLLWNNAIDVVKRTHTTIHTNQGWPSVNIAVNMAMGCFLIWSLNEIR